MMATSQRSAAEIPVETAWQRLLVVRLSAMGDVLHTLPAVCALRRALPSAYIGWLIEERWAELLCAPGSARGGERSPQRPVVDWVHTVRLKEWRRFTPHSKRQISVAWNRVRTEGYNVALDLQGSIRSAVLARLSKAPAIYGPRNSWEWPAHWLYNHKVEMHGEHVVEQWHSLVEALLGRKLPIESVELPHDERAEGHVDSQLRALKITDYAVLSPGAGWGAKQWPAERFGVLARQLAQQGLLSVVNYGPGEQHLADIVFRESGRAARPLEGSISDLIALLRRAKLFIGGDSGPMHVAAALKVPVVALFGPTNPARNGPYGTHSVVLRDPSSITSHARNAEPDGGLLKIQPEAVLEAAQTLLAAA